LPVWELPLAQILSSEFDKRAILAVHSYKSLFPKLGIKRYICNLVYNTETTFADLKVL